MRGVSIKEAIIDATAETIGTRIIAPTLIATPVIVTMSTTTLDIETTIIKMVQYGIGIATKLLPQAAQWREHYSVALLVVSAER